MTLGAITCKNTAPSALTERFLFHLKERYHAGLVSKKNTK